MENTSTSQSAQKKYTLSNFISIFAAFIIVGMMLKVAHVTWADSIIIAALGLEALTFLLIGLQKESVKREVLPGSSMGVQSAALSHEEINRLQELLGSLNATQKMTNSVLQKQGKAIELNTEFINKLATSVGIDVLSSQLEAQKGLTALDVSELQDEINHSATSLKLVNSSLSNLTENVNVVSKFYMSQVEAIKKGL